MPSAATRALVRSMRAAAVAQVGQRVGERLPLAGAKHSHVLAEGDCKPDDDRKERCRRQTDRERPDVADRSRVDKDAEGKQRERRGHDQHPPAVECDAANTGGRLPGRQREQHDRERPAHVKDAARVIGADGVLDTLATTYR